MQLSEHLSNEIRELDRLLAIELLESASKLDGEALEHVAIRVLVYERPVGERERVV